jgi:hypothetical protein
MKDVLIVTADPLNMIDVIREGMKAHTELTFDYIDHDFIKKSFRYKNFRQRAANFIQKNFSGKNIKHEYYDSSVKKIMDGFDSCYKKILIIRPDLLNDNHLQMLRERTNCFIAYYWDTVDLIPRKQNIIHYFDRILSFDPEDCKKYGFDFQPNFYCYENSPEEIRYQVYNLSTLDNRKGVIEEIAVALEQEGLSYLFKGFREKPFKNTCIQYTPRVSYQQMLNEARYCNVVLDVVKSGQSGLSFRPFEALGLNKKLITTNVGIREYEFYDPENVLVLEPGNVSIEKDFFEQPFKDVDCSVKEKYHIKQWLTNVLN